MKCLGPFFHPWDKWGPIIVETFSRNPDPLDAQAYEKGEKLKWSEQVQYRSCESCGRQERRRVR